MRQLTSVADFDNASKDNYYGFIVDEDGYCNIGFVSQTQNDFFVVCPFGITNGNCYGFYNKELPSLLAQLAEHNIVIEFLEAVEFYQWLADGVQASEALRILREERRTRSNIITPEAHSKEFNVFKQFVNQSIGVTTLNSAEDRKIEIDL